MSIRSNGKWTSRDGVTQLLLLDDLFRWLGRIVAQSVETERNVKAVTTASDRVTPWEKKIFMCSSCRYDWSAEPPLLSSRARICWAYWQSLLSSLWSCGLHRCEGTVQCSVSEPECSRIMFPIETLNIPEFRNFVGWWDVPLQKFPRLKLGWMFVGNEIEFSDRLLTEGPFVHRSYARATALGLVTVGIRTPAALTTFEAWSKQKSRLAVVFMSCFIKRWI